MPQVVEENFKSKADAEAALPTFAIGAITTEILPQPDGTFTVRATFPDNLQAPGGAQPVPGAPAQNPGAPAQQPAGGAAIHARPGPHQAVIDALIAGANARGFDPLGLLTIVSIESSFNPTICNRTTSAAGLFQFIDSTWAACGGATFPGRGGVGNGQAAGAPVDVQVAIGCKFEADLAAQLKAKLGRDPGLVGVYMAHQQGLGGALKILSADPNAAIESIIGAAAARNNGFGGLTVAQTISKFNNLVQSHENAASALVQAA